MIGRARFVVSDTENPGCPHARIAVPARHGRFHGPGGCARHRSAAPCRGHRLPHQRARGRDRHLGLRTALRPLPAALWAGRRSHRQDPCHRDVPGGLLVRNLRLRVRAGHRGVRHAPLPHRRCRRGSHADVARPHRRHVPVPGAAGGAGAIHERADDRPDCRQHARRHLRRIRRLALRVRRLRHRRAGGVGAARARRAAAGGTANGDAAAGPGTADRATRRHADLCRVPRGRAGRLVGGARSARRVSA